MTNKSLQAIARAFLHCSFHCFIFVICVSATIDCWAVERKAINANGLVATYYYKLGSMQQPPIIFFGGSSGGNFYDNYQNYAEDLVNLGYTVLNLAYFDYNSNGEIPNKLRHIPLEYFKKAMDWMEDQPQTSKGTFAVVGNSRGGEAALLLAIQYPKISTVIALVSSAYVGGVLMIKKEKSLALHGR